MVRGRILVVAHSRGSECEGFTDEQLAQIMGSLGAAPMKEFQDLFRNIRKIDFYDSRVLGWAAPEPSAAVQTILERCPVLEDFTANHLLATDVVRRQEWVSTRIKKLKVDIIVDNDNREEKKEKEKEMKKKSHEELHAGNV